MKKGLRHTIIYRNENVSKRGRERKRETFTKGREKESEKKGGTISAAEREALETEDGDVLLSKAYHLLENA